MISKRTLSGLSVQPLLCYTSACAQTCPHPIENYASGFMLECPQMPLPVLWYHIVRPSPGSHSKVCGPMHDDEIFQLIPAAFFLGGGISGEVSESASAASA